MTVPGSLLKHIYKERQDWCKKGDFGKLLVVGGSKLYSGSPIFNAMSAYRAGCDLVKIMAPEKAAQIVKSYLPDMIAYPVDRDFISPKHVKTITDTQKYVDAMVIGGGIGRNPGVLAAVRAILKKTTIPTVVDADALYTVNFALRKNFVVTPHSREFSMLSGKDVTTNIENRKAATKELAKKLNCIVLLKGHLDVITDGFAVAVNDTGNKYMTKGGFGDTLAGICGALLARHVDAFDAACAAAYINGKAGQLAVKKFGEGVLASDLINEIPNVIKDV